MDRNGLIGAGGALPWHLPADLKYFKRNTMAKPILMGRKTLESIGRPLPGRDNLVLTRDAAFRADGVSSFTSLATALEWSRGLGCGELAVIGGAQIYSLTLPQVDHLFLTRVHGVFAGDTWFPHVDWRAWNEVRREDHAPDARHAYPYSFIELERVHNPNERSGYE